MQSTKNSNVEDIYPLTPVQHGMLFHTLMDPRAGVYIEQLVCTIGSTLDVSAFERALQLLVERHAVLRSAFVWEKLKAPLQVVQRQLRVALTHLDLRGPDAEQALAQFLERDLRQGFDLAKAPALRFSLVRVDETSYRFVWSAHHILYDGWSFAQLIAELLDAYSAFKANRAPKLAPVRPFRDYIAWLKRQDMAQAETYWRAALANVTAPTPLSLDRPDAARNGCEELHWALDAERSARLYAWSRQHGVTMNTIVQGVWAILLGCYSQQDEVLFGITVAGRPSDIVGVETMVGLFINTLPLRVKVDGAERFSNWLLGLQSQNMELRQFEYAPLTQIQSWSAMPNGVPMFDSLVVFENFPVDASVRASDQVLPISDIRGVEQTNYALTLVAVMGQSLEVKFIYDRRRFDEATVARMAAHFDSVMSAVLADPAACVGALPLQGVQQERQMLVDWNATAISHGGARTAHQLFEEQVGRTPQAPAVRFGQEVISYAALNARANRLARCLRARAIGPDTLVGLCAERSPQMIVGLLAILKAGGAYMPLDPAYPAGRLATMLDDAKPTLVLSQEGVRERLPAGTAILDLDEAWPGASEEADANLESLNLPGNLAYLIFTSGSSGRPKGVLLEHAGLCNLVRAQIAAFNVRAGQNVLQFASLNFDASVSEIFMALASGATLCLASREDLMPGALEHTLGAMEINVATLPPVVLGAMAPQAFSQLATLAVAGEACPAAVVDQWAGGRRLLNAYGPTEATVCATIAYCDAQQSGAPPIGRPIDNVECYILNGALAPVPVGVAGQLYIGGAGLARGYLGQPAATAEKFIPNPFGVDGSRLYCSGDLARYRADGSIEYLGRIDNQVKIRGFRIEPGDIEAALHQLAQVREAVVVAREDRPGERRLVAYVVAHGAGAIEPSQMRAALLESLPDYMVPAHFVVLERLPTTPNGKIDHQALPAPDGAGAQHDYVAPATPVEEIVATIFADVLKLEPVGTADNFFELGGHSLLLTQVLSQVRVAFKLDLPLRALFENASVGALARAIVLAQRSGEAGEAAAIVPLSHAGPLALSFAQQRLWFLDQYEPSTAFYNIPAALRLCGPLDVDALKRSLNEIVRRHASLRTRFAMRDGATVQIIDPELKLGLPVTDLSELAPPQGEAKALTLAQEEALAPFDLATGPLMRAGLLRLDAHEHVFLFTMHHIVSDGWSASILVSELAALYGAFLQGRPSPLPELSIQYADFAHWQRQWLSGEVLRRQLDYWTGQLKDAPALLALPTDFARPPVQVHEGAVHGFTISASTTAALTQLSRKTQSTLFMVLACAFNILLARYARQDDICIGTPIANRNRSETEDLIGFFVNTLVLRTRIDSRASFGDLLQQVRANALAAYAHQDVPFEQLVEVLKPERQLSHSPLFQVMLVLQNAPAATLDLAGLSVQPLQLDGGSAKFDLTLSMAAEGDRIEAGFEYNTALFAPATIARMADHFMRLLDAIVAAPAARIADLEMLGSAERERMLVAWNATATTGCAPQTIHAMFETQAAQTPDATAIVWQEQHISFAQLNTRANVLAHHLRARGVGPDMLVGVCIDRSLDMVVGLLAILKAGAAYVPLDPDYPQERLAYILADANPALVLTQQGLLARLPIGATSIFCVDAHWGELDASQTGNPNGGALPDNLAYVIYTSGSTGKPKGTLLQHTGLCNLVDAQSAAFGIGPGQRVLQFASLNFDASASELFTALCSGATLCMAARDDLLPGALEHTLDALKITVATLPPAVLAVLAAAPYAHLATLIVAGDACPPALAAQWAQGRRFLNAYGPTETTVCATFQLRADDATVLPIGRPIANTGCFILDQESNPVPVGVAGELHLAGINLARGYLNRPDLTADRFIPNPFAAQPGGRLYRTGDLARYLADGTIEYLGRVDNQIKMRGMRIEPGEIEAALGALDGVHEALVLAHEDSSGDRRLIAYVLSRAGCAPDSAHMRAALQQTLPDFMVPAHFVFVDAWPLSPNGKIDRKALPVPDQRGGDAAHRAYMAPNTPTQEVLAAIWAEVLKLERVGTRDDFFALGGHSLLLTQVVSQVRSAFHVDIALRTMFEAPTVAALALRIDAARRDDGTPVLPMIGVAARDKPLALSFAQQRLWFLDQYAPESAIYNMPTAMRLSGQLATHALHASLNEIVRRHESLRTRFTDIDGSPIQTIAPTLDLGLALTDLSSLAPAERTAKAHELAQEEARRPFDLASGPVIRAALLRLDEDEHILLLTMHHIVSDGWSAGVLVRELAALYSGFALERPSSLAALPIQYADYAQWQREWLSGDVLQAQLSYWTEQLYGAPTLLALPTDRPRPAIQSHRGTSLSFDVPASTLAGLYALGRRTQTTLFMSLTAAFSVLLARESGQTDICIGTPIANRNKAEIEGLIGFFANTLVVRSQIDSAASFESLLLQVRDTLLDAYAHQDVPFEQVVDAVAPLRSPSHAPLFQVMLILQNAPVDALELPGLTLQQIDSDIATSKFDLRLAFWEHEGALHGSVEYSTDLFDAATMQRMGSHLSCLLAAVAANPGAIIGELPLLDPQQKQLLLRAWDSYQPSFTRIADADLALALGANNVLELFAQSVRAAPTAIAVEWGEQRFDYAQLDARANQLANALRASGAEAGSIVAILLEDPVAQIVATLGVLKAGAVYASINAAYPQQRIGDIMALITPQCLVSQAPCASRVAQLLSTQANVRHLLLLDTPSCPFAPTGIEGLREHDVRTAATIDPAVWVAPDAPCHIYFTSGSTGTPKAVLGRTQGLAHFIEWEIEALGLDAGTRASQLTNPSFHVYLRDVLPALCAGGTICIAPSADVFAGAALSAWMEHSAVTLMHCVPSSFRVLLDAELTPQRLPQLKQVVVGGGALLPADTNRFVECFGARVQLYGVYGQTETTLAKMVYRVPAERTDAAFIPMGKPLPGAQAILLKANMEPCAQGEVGELYLRTPYRSLGYYRDEALTGASFVRNPYSAGPDDILYKTGDLAMLLADGQFRFMGRSDFQVKIRGMRVETGEVEAALLTLPGVRQAAVIAQAVSDGELVLVAYVVRDDHEAQADGGEYTFGLRTMLLEMVPDYMVPAQFVVLEQMPLTVNGKLDRKALPAVDLSVGDAQYLAPRTPDEGMLAAIWIQVLKLERVGVHDNFFMLGGHSLLATQVVSQVRLAFHVELPLRALFEGPTIAAMAQAIQAEHDNLGMAAPPLTAQQRGAAQALSFSQQRLWFLAQFESDSAAYNLPSAVRLIGQLDIDALERGINEVVRRHDALRTRFAMHEGVPVQIVAPHMMVEMTVSDLSGLADAQRQTRALELAQVAAKTPFDLQTGPLLRASLLRLGADEHVLLFALHHIVSDGWSNGILVTEVATLYRAYRAGLPSPLPELSIQYADYAHWQRRWLSGAVLERQLHYWRAQLENAPGILHLPTDRPRPPVQTYHGASHAFAISAATTAHLHALGRATQTTLFMGLLAALNVLLSRYAGQDDICIGTPIANRNRAEVEPLIGFFVNTLVLRTRIDSRASFVALLRQVRKTALGAYAHQDIPFEQLVEDLKPKRQLSHAPMFQVMLALQNAPAAVLELPGLAIHPLPADSATAKFDLTLSVVAEGDELGASLEYNTDLFDAATAARMADQFTRLLEAIVLDPNAPICTLSMQSDAERDRILRAWNDTVVSYAAAPTLHQMFEAQVERTPDALALDGDAQPMRYTQLNARANQLAQFLRSRGVGPDSLVGVCLARSAEMVIALLAILKAGGAYVALDPAYPQERLAAMLEDAAPVLVLSESGLVARLPLEQDRIICVDVEPEAIATSAQTNPGCVSTAANLAYVLFTSGSSGRPKGVAMTIGALRNLIAWQLEHRTHARGAPGRVFQFASLNFDVSFQEIFSALCGGDTLVLCAEARRQDLQALRRYIEDTGCQRVFLPNAVVQHFAGLAGPGAANLAPMSPGCEIVSAGEQLQITPQLSSLARRLGGHFLYNQYGPSETHVVTQFALASAGMDAWPALPPIGKPIANTECYILDADYDPVPIGVPGQLHIGGAGLARGYLGRPDLTAEKFIPNPFGGVAGARLYRTGDLARYLEDGNIEYLGRIDQQVKVRGFRVELGEIETALADIATVADAVAVLRADEGGEKRLVAYVVPREGVSFDAPALRRALAQTLPDYMLPAQFVEMAQLPLTPNGKVNRDILPAPHSTRDARGYVAPNSPIEEVLAEIWAGLLKLDRVGTEDNFFELGGHSLLAMRLIAKVQEVLEVDLAPRALFDTPTIAATAAIIEAMIIEKIEGMSDEEALSLANDVSE
ncbi:MAG: amino acid adenylation domain-containing protein [Pseudomonadota bacterium]